MNSAAQSYLDLHIDPELSQKASRRSVGIIWLSPTWIGRAAADNIKTTVERINTTKAAIEDFIISNYQTRHERFEALRAECPGVMTLHLYRQIRCYAQEELSSIRFSWQRKDSLKNQTRTNSLNDYKKSSIAPGQHIVTPWSCSSRKSSIHLSTFCENAVK
ncbi:DNA replication terminus site-binding protein [Edwardsiella tarda]|uniref:DNA replication terminus site-binding protein n=1 Tax=Edwardsiella tarda TaxID=636 RepID=UPI00356B63D7